MIDYSLLDSLGISLDALARERLDAFHCLLIEYNRKMDLTNVPEAEMTLRHYADSLMPLRHGLVPVDGLAIDVGSGAGFPGLPLAVARPGLQVTLLESKGKRCDFLKEAVKMLGLPNVRVLPGRAEDMAVPPERERYDLAFARAVAPLNVLAEYLLPFLRVGGLAMCWKGPAVQEELAAGRAASHLLGGELGESRDIGIPGRSSLIQLIHKHNPTAEKYPRKAGTPEKSPLGIKNSERRTSPGQPRQPG